MITAFCFATVLFSFRAAMARCGRHAFIRDAGSWKFALSRGAKLILQKFAQFVSLDVGSSSEHLTDGTRFLRVETYQVHSVSIMWLHVQSARPLVRTIANFARPNFA